ncbi:MAG: tetratricopeptide repeat protein [Blastocatellia bacterium]|nr:tetratricopeptide repeat protein [Blastocatellia bacterium]
MLKARLNYELSIVLVVSGNYEQAQLKADEALQNWRLLDDKCGIALTLLAIGDIKKRLQGNRQQALEYYQQAELLFPADMAFYDNANLLNSFASVYEDYNSYQLSFNYRKKRWTILSRQIIH